MLSYKEKGLPANALHGQVQAGQVLLIVVLAIIVSSTIVLSLASRNITSIRTSTEEAESQKALAAAEAGIERTIQGSVPVGIASSQNLNSDDTINSSYSTEVVSVQSSRFLMQGGNTILKDEGADVWFVEYDPVTGIIDYLTAPLASLSSLNLYWGSDSVDLENCTSNLPAAIQAIVVTKNRDNGEIKSYRYAYDPCESARGNNLTHAISQNFDVDYDGDGKKDITFRYKTPPDHLANGLTDIIFMRVVPLYKDTVIGVDGCSALGYACPSQGYIISSTGKSGSAIHKITTFRGRPQAYLPYVSYGLFVAN